MSKYLETQVIQYRLNLAEKEQAANMGMDYEPEGFVRRHTLNLLLVDHFTEAEISHEGIVHYATNVHLGSGEVRSVLTNYREFSEAFYLAKNEEQ